MRCPECVRSGKRSRVFPLGVTATLVGWEPFYDEDGLFHAHDPNAGSASYRCSEGHEWVEAVQRECWCGWPVVAAAEGAR